MATEPARPTKAWLPPAGLWTASDWNSLPAGYDFGGWRNGDEAWNFATDTVTEAITLTAQWSAPAPNAVPIPGVAANNIPAAVAHANTNAGAFTLAIDQDVTSGQNTMDQSNTNLTIIGIGEPREIRFTATVNNQSLFEVGRAGGGGAVFDDTIRLTLGNNITLVGRTQGQHGQTGNNGQHLIRVRRAKLFMEDGAKVTGHTSTSTGTAGALGSAINVGVEGVFTMSGGEITGNRAVRTATNSAGGVFLLDDTSRFIMTGGSITGNTRGPEDDSVYADVTLYRDADHMTISGTAAIYRLILNYWSNPRNYNFIEIRGWSGSVCNLDLRSDTDNLELVISRWTGTTGILRAATGHTITSADAGRIASARFIGHTNMITQLIAAYHEIAIEDGGAVGVVREN